MKSNSNIVASLLVCTLLSGVTLKAQSLAQALDTTGLVWTTNGNAGWIGQASMSFDNTSFDGVDAAASGAIGANQESVFETTITNGPGKLSFWWRVSSEATEPSIMKPGDALEFYINDASFTNLLDSISGDLGWRFREYDVPEGTQTLRWRYVKDGQLNFASDKAWVDQVIFITTQTIPLAQALDTSGLVWTSGGNTNPTVWTGLTNLTVLGGVTNLSHDEVDSAQSGAIHHLQQSWMETTVSGATNVTFWWKVSSEGGYDVLEFSVVGILTNKISGEVDWQQKSFVLSTNTQTLRWRYYKDDTQSLGQDRGWVDQVFVAPNQADPLPFSLTSPNRLPDGRFRLTLSTAEQRNYRILVSTNLTSWSTLTNVTSTNVNTTIVDSAASNFTRRFYQGVTP